MKPISIAALSAILLLSGALTAAAGFLHTRYGVVEGRVIIREFDETVFTVVSKDKRLFQYYARDVQSVTAANKVLSATDVTLREEPSNDAAPVVDLLAGFELEFTKEKPRDNWVQVRAWGDNVGWMPYAELTDSVDFPDEPEAASVPAAASPEQQAATQ
ncbi:MAG: hypothetical protein GC154_04360 [bacterium]|nr:hypothetical protein [bacterium]